MEKPLLSICIATYNRAAFIGETLESIVSQLREEVEVVVADGASTDNTSDVVNGYSKKHPEIRYIQLGSKGGVDHDYCKAVEFAKADMCWLFTDDDLIKAGALDRVLSEIRNGFSLIIVNAEVRNIDFTKMLRKSQMKIKNNVVFEKENLDDLFRCVIPYLSFIGGVVIKKKLWLQREKETYFGTEFIHLGVIFQEPLSGKTLVMAEPLITIRWGNAQWSRRSFEIWIMKWPKLINSFKYISKSSRKEYSMSPTWERLNIILHERKEAGFSASQYRLWLNIAKDTPAWWKLTVKTISVLPIPLVRMMINSYGQLKKKLA